MKDRIKQVMEMQHMTQQVFARFIGISASTLSSIFTGRTKPTIQIATSIKNKIPNISTDWLMFGIGEMFLSDDAISTTPPPSTASEKRLEPMLDFGIDEPSHQPTIIAPTTKPQVQNDKVDMVKNIDKVQRKITEIRIFYDDQTWETFLPKR